MTDHSRMTPPARVAALIFIIGSFYFLSGWILDSFFFFLPLAVSVLVLASAVSGPVGNVAALLLLGGSMIHPALMHGRWDLLILGWSVLLISSLLIFSQQARLKVLELASQGHYEEALENVNALQKSVEHLSTASQVFQKRLQRYATLRSVMDVLSAQASNLDVLLASVARQALSVLDHADVSLVYLVEIPRHELALHAVFWKDQSGTVKRKTGDLYDQWVFRQGQPLLVRDVTDRKSVV